MRDLERALEAYNKTIVVASDSGGYKENIIDNHTGFAKVIVLMNLLIRLIIF